MTERIAKKYAKALFELCQVSELDAVKGQLIVIQSVLEESNQLQEALSNPAYPMRERAESLKAVAQKAGCSDQRVLNLLVLALENRRLDSLDAIVTHFSLLVDAVKRALSLKVYSAFPIKSAESDSLKSRLEKEFGGMADVQWFVEPSLIGGLKIEAGDKLFDSSLKSALEKVRAELV